MSKTNYKEQINSFYNEFFTQNRHNTLDPVNVAWSSKEAQYSRFKVLSDIGIDKDSTILDFGCGLGHYTDYLFSNVPDYNLKNYTGLDINQNYIDNCNHIRRGIRFICGEIFDLSESFDYVIGSGVFTVMMPKNEILEAIAKAYELSNKGVAFNFLTKDFLELPWVSSFNQNEFFQDEILPLYSNAKLVTGYYKNEDFTIYIYK
jgi:cyclopropane fatty-acyl-phospholipid synthase-like methyltransferase